MIVVMCGVPKRGCTLLTPGGSSWSRLIAKKMRGWLMSMTSSTLVMPATAPADTRGPVLLMTRQRVRDGRVEEPGRSGPAARS